MPIAEPPSAKATAYLELLSGEQAGTRYPLNGGKSILGRHPDCQIVIDVGAVSRQHATIVNDAKGYWIEDLKSRNGTFVNDQQITGRTALKPDDKIKICDYEFGFHRSTPDVKQTFTAGRTLSDFGFGVMMDEDETADGQPSEDSQNGVLSKLDLRSGFDGTLRLTSNPEVKLRALLEITQSLGRTFSNETVLPKLLDSLFKIFMQADRGLVALKTKEGKIVPMAVKTRRGGEDESIRLSRTIVNDVLNNKQAILSKNTADDARFDMSQSITDFHIRSLVCAPLINSEGEVLGLIQLDSLDTRSQFQNEDLEVLYSVAMQAAFVMENIALHENLIQQHKLERDLQLAHKVQQGLLPKAPPLIDHYHFFDFYEAANQVGGDFYDALMVAPDKLLFVIGDVTGKGMPAALYMALSKALTKSILSRDSARLAEAVGQLNRDLLREADEAMGVTMLIGVLDCASGELGMVNAGHENPIVRRADGSIETLAMRGGPPFCVMDFPYPEEPARLEPGDTLVLITDGATEAQNADEQLFGMDGTLAALGDSPDGAAATASSLADRVRAFEGDTEPSDDLTIMALKRL